MDDVLKQVPLVAETTLTGGAKREIRILLDPAILGPGIVQLDDNIIETAPLLHVEY